MNHLTIDEINDFVSFTAIDKDTLSLAAKVNSHILKCAECRAKVIECQQAYDEKARADKTVQPELWSAPDDEDPERYGVNPI